METEPGELRRRIAEIEDLVRRAGEDLEENRRYVQIHDSLLSGDRHHEGAWERLKKAEEKIEELRTWANGLDLTDVDKNTVFRERAEFFLASARWAVPLIGGAGLIQLVRWLTGA